MDLTNAGDGSLGFDVARAQEVVDGQEPSVWDVELYAGDRVFVGRWEDMPSDQTEVEFHPPRLPLGFQRWCSHKRCERMRHCAVGGPGREPSGWGRGGIGDVRTCGRLAPMRP